MSPWQKRARFAVAAIGLVFAALVYFAIGRRPPPAAPTEVKRIDPAASAESSGCQVLRFRGERRDFELTCKTQLAYPDGSLRMIGVTIHVNKPDGRTYLVTAGEAYAGQDQKQLQLSSGVTLRASDGFEMTADRGNYNSDLGSIHTDVPVSFTKARMRGSGTAVDYNENSDVLTIGQAAQITTVDEAGNTILDFRAGTATLDRLHDVLTMNGRVHVLRDQQVMDADNAVAHLAPSDEFVTFIELRGNSRVEGGGGTLDAMSARDIDLDYSDDGARLERVVLTGTGAVTLTGNDQAAGRQLTGESLDVQLAADGTVAAVTGRENVRMVLPAADSLPARTIRGRALDATGAPGQGLTSARFTDAVEYREEAAGGSSRVGHSRRLDLTLTGNSVSHATFAGDFTFEEPSFRAQSTDARYDPAKGSLHLSGADSRGLPCVADDRLAVDAETIDVTVDTRELRADGKVKTTIRPEGATGAVGSSACAVARQRAGAQAAVKPAADARLPGLLKQDQIAVVTADALEYGGTGKTMVYTGSAYLSQGPDTTLRGDVIRIDQEQGGLTVTGHATSRLLQGSGNDRELVQGRAEEIQYEDGRRLITYRNAPASAPKGSSNTPVQVNSPKRNLTANTIEIVLSQEDGRAERLEAFQNVTAKIDAKTATADRLIYLSEKDQYDLLSTGRIPVMITDACGQTSGKALTYLRTDNIIRVLGKDEQRAQTKSAACRPSTPASR